VSNGASASQAALKAGGSNEVFASSKSRATGSTNPGYVTNMLSLPFGCGALFSSIVLL
jgi:hypothetical protein